MEIIEKAHRVRVTSYGLFFAYDKTYNAGFSFPCDKDGKVDESQLAPLGLENYRKCLTGNVNGQAVLPPIVNDYSHSYWACAVGRCRCGQTVQLDGFTNTCACGRDYNSNGQLLAPREQWGEDTGETLADILAIP